MGNHIACDVVRLGTAKFFDLTSKASHLCLYSLQPVLGGREINRERHHVPSQPSHPSRPSPSDPHLEASGAGPEGDVRYL